MDRFAVDAATPIFGDIDLEECVARIPSDFTMKGMFFARFVNALEGEWEAIARVLEAPPKHGRYTAFEDYPARDYYRVFDRVARLRFPGSTREAYRLLARGEIEVFAESTLGKVTFSLVREPGEALLRCPDVFSALWKGTAMSAERMGPSRIVLTFAPHIGAIEHTLGLLEGVVQNFEAAPTTTVEAQPRATGERLVLDISFAAAAA